MRDIDKCRKCQTRLIVYCHVLLCAECNFIPTPVIRKLRRGKKKCTKCTDGMVFKGGSCQNCLNIIDSISPPPFGFVSPSEPTDARPGSIEKILVMRERAERGSIFHKDDRRL